MFPARMVVCLFLVGILGACSETTLQTTAIDQASGSYAGPVPGRGPNSPYAVGPGDRLRIKVYSDPDMTGEYEVNSGGFVSLPLVGDVKAAGLTTRQVEQSIAQRMKGKVANDPHVSVEIATYAPYYVFGEVKNAGELTYHVGITVADAVAAAGGLTYRADPNKIFLRRAGSPVEQVVPVNAPVKVYPGDNIRVAESLF